MPARTGQLWGFPFVLGVLSVTILLLSVHRPAQATGATVMGTGADISGVV